MVNILKEQQEKNKELLNEIETLKKQLTDKEESLKLNIWNISFQADETVYSPGHWWYKQLSKKWLEESKVRRENEKVYFDNLSTEEMTEGFLNHSKELAETCSSYISNWSKRGYQLTEQKRKYEKKIKELEAELEEKDNKIEELYDEVWMEREEAEKALDTAMKWRKHQMFETVLKHDAAMGKLLDQIDLLENNLAAKNQEIDWRNYLENKELPALPKQKENRLRKLKKLVSKVKEKTKEKFQTLIVQKNK